MYNDYDDVFNTPHVVDVLDQLKTLCYTAIKDGYSQQEIMDALQNMAELSLYFANMDLEFETT